MSVFSKLGATSRLATLQSVLKTSVRNGGDHPVVVPRPSRWAWDQFKDQLHFYILLTGIPLGTFIALTNIFVGPGELRPIPEGYVPKDEEYYRSPMTRYIVRYFKHSLQESYERYLHQVWEEHKLQNMRQLKKEVQRQMKLQADYKGWYYRETAAEYVRMARTNSDNSTSGRGNNFRGDYKEM